MKQSGRKLARGQMVYAPISSSERVSRSPFSSSKKMVTESQQQNLQQQLAVRRQPYQQSVQNRSQLIHQQIRNHFKQQTPVTLRQSLPSYHQYEQQLQNLIRQNQQLKSRQQMYMSKLIKLQQGLQKQHQEFMNLQELYTELFNSYKQKEQEIDQLESRYKETQRQMQQFNSFRKEKSSVLEAQKVNSFKNNIIQENFKSQLTQLIYQNKRLNQTNEKLISELNYIRSKQKLAESRQSLQQKVFEELNDWQKQADHQKQQKIKLQYEIRFFRMRNQDLQKTIAQLQKIISIKQNQIIKMRQQKLSIRRQSSQKALNRSPPKPNIDSARSKGSNQQSKKLVKLIQNLQKQSHQLRQQNVALKQKLKGSYFLKENHRSYDSKFNDAENPLPLHRKLEFQENYHKDNQITHRSYQNENFNSQNINQQYFSFSRERQERQYSEEDLPSFPMDMQIEGIIKKHKQSTRENNYQDKVQIQNAV